MVKSSKSPQKLKLVSEHFVTGVVAEGGVLGVKKGGTRDEKGWPSFFSSSWPDSFSILVALFDNFEPVQVLD